MSSPASAVEARGRSSTGAAGAAVGFSPRRVDLQKSGEESNGSSSGFDTEGAASEWFDPDDG